MRRKYNDIDPEDIFIDSVNTPGFSHERFEGKMEQPIGERTYTGLKILLICIVVFLAARLLNLEVMKGSVYAQVSENNRLDKTTIFADRGVIYDRNKVELAGNGIKEGSSTDFALRVYAPIEGLAPVIGYTKYPSKDSNGNYYDTSYHGQAGVEKVYDPILAGTNGSKLIETDARGHVTSESAVDVPKPGGDVTLSLDAKLTQEMYQAIKQVALDHGFTGGGGVIMDIKTGEVLALTSYPEYDSNVVSAGTDKAEISRLLTDPNKPFLNRVVSGLYTPGSIVKPIMALGALSEHTIDPMKKILANGSISLPNPYDKEHPSVFKDWKIHGWIDMRDAIAVSSDVYFYEVGGGFQDQKGLGITNIDKYFDMFGLTAKTGIDLPAETSGTIASPLWKAANFPDDPTWRIGDTYHTSIGQYGTQVTPIEAVRWVASIANGGTLLVPTLIQGERTDDKKIFKRVDLSPDYFEIVREGMREGVMRGAVTSLNNPDVKMAAKTGTAELGSKKQFVNSWVTGFFPYDTPRYAFALIMERGPVTNLVGATAVMRQIVDWMALNTPEYLK